MNQYKNMKSNSRIAPASFRTLTIWQYRHIIALIISISVFICLVLPAWIWWRSARSQAQIFDHNRFYLCTLKFCNRARTRSARKTPGEVRPDSISGAWRKIRTPNRRSGISGICAICRRSAADQRKDQRAPGRVQYQSQATTSINHFQFSNPNFTKIL